MRYATQRLLVVLFSCCVCASALATPDQYFFDDLGRLVRVERADCTVIDYSYDAVGNRLGRTVVNDRDCDTVPDALDRGPLDAGALRSRPKSRTWPSPSMR